MVDIKKVLIARSKPVADLVVARKTRVRAEVPVVSSVRLTKANWPFAQEERVRDQRAT